MGCALSFQPHHCHSRLWAGISLEIGAAPDNPHHYLATPMLTHRGVARLAALASRLSIGVARLPKHSFHFVFCPPGLLELRSSQGLKPAVFATLSPVLIELTSSVPLAPRQIHKEPPLRGGSLCIGVARFELTTFCSQSRRSTRLSYTPKWQQI